MSAALVLAATELFEQFSHVGGEQREQAGLGPVCWSHRQFSSIRCPEGIREISQAQASLRVLRLDKSDI